MEEVPRKVSARGIGIWWPEEGDRRKGATMAWELELRSTLDEVRRKREMTSGSHTHPDKYLGDAWRTVREAGVTLLRYVKAIYILTCLSIEVCQDSSDLP